MKTREEILRRIKNAKSWRETGVTLDEAYAAFSDDFRCGATREHKLPKDASERSWNTVKTSSVVDIDIAKDVVKELKEKIDRLTDANKQLRAQNKALKAGEKK